MLELLFFLIKLILIYEKTPLVNLKITQIIIEQIFKKKNCS